MNKEEVNINETIEKLDELVHGQQRAIGMCNEIISMKNSYIKLCEMETDLYKKEVKRLHRTIFWISVCIGAYAMLSLLSHIL